jgi:hypothetical protein
VFIVDDADEVDLALDARYVHDAEFVLGIRDRYNLSGNS